MLPRVNLVSSASLWVLRITERDALLSRLGGSLPRDRQISAWRGNYWFDLRGNGGRELKGVGTHPRGKTYF